MNSSQMTYRDIGPQTHIEQHHFLSADKFQTNTFCNYLPSFLMLFKKYLYNLQKMLLENKTWKKMDVSSVQRTWQEPDLAQPFWNSVYQTLPCLTRADQCDTHARPLQSDSDSEPDHTTPHRIQQYLLSGGLL